jgi:Fic family protein
MADLLEMPSRIEPCLFDDNVPSKIADLAADLATAAATLGGRLHRQTAASLADLVRLMNSYYSNLIEGHHTLPKDIERALADDLDANEARRNFQIEHRQHIRLQKLIDQQHAQGGLPMPTSADMVRWLHREFYREAPETLMWIEGAGRRFRMEPGAFRSQPIHDVQVGRHVPPPSDRVESFMGHFEKRYRLDRLGRSGQIIAMAAAHHRLNFIHPFPDGNGRVSRLMSHAIGLQAGIGVAGLWSVSRGLARGLESPQEYMQMMAYADSPRQGDLDGRGNLSLKALAEFVEWFLKVCLDQVVFMGGLFELDHLARRYKHYFEQESLQPEAFYIVEHLLLAGEMPRGEASRRTGLKERSAREVLSGLIERGLVASAPAKPKGPVSLRFPVAAAERLFPLLFPQNIAAV